MRRRESLEKIYISNARRARLSPEKKYTVYIGGKMDGQLKYPMISLAIGTWQAKA